jgi:hypothetical protein
VKSSAAIASDISTPARALWNQRQVVGRLCERFKTLSTAVNSPGELALYQWVQIGAFALEFRPDLIIELGRKNGNSTCCFLEVASELKETGSCTVLSLCLDDSWQRKTLPELRTICSPHWFSHGDIRLANILDYDFAPVLEKVSRCLVFWDAHGFDVAECVLGGLLPKLVRKNHLVIMHDMTDARYEHPEVTYNGAGLWKGESASGLYFRIGSIVSDVGQAISILDFASRNQLPLHSASESIQTELAKDPQRTATLQHLLGDEFFSVEAHWLWFSLCEVSGTITFPRFSMEQHSAGQPVPRWRDVWHPLRDLVAPGGSGRRKVYDALMRRIRHEA